MSEQQQSQLDLPLTEQETWTRPGTANGCGRDPDAGEGTCWWWWEGCPKAAKRGCYQLWFHTRAKKEAQS